MSTFTRTDLSGHRVLVTGIDSVGIHRQTILDSKEFDNLNLVDEQKAAAAEFDSAVEAFFAPLTEAAAKVEDAMKALEMDDDPAFYVVVQEASEGRESQAQILHHLSIHTVILRMLHSGNTDRLLWVGDKIEILKLGTTAPTHYTSNEPTDPDTFED